MSFCVSVIDATNDRIVSLKTNSSTAVIAPRPARRPVGSRPNRKATAATVPRM